MGSAKKRSLQCLFTVSLQVCYLVLEDSVHQIQLDDDAYHLEQSHHYLTSLLHILLFCSQVESGVECHLGYSCTL